MSVKKLSDVNTVKDLLELQKNAESEEQQPSVADNLMKQILNEDPAVGIELAQRICYALRDLHKAGVEQYKEEGDVNAVAIWYGDALMLQQCLDLLKDIVLWYPTENPSK